MTRIEQLRQRQEQILDIADSEQNGKLTEPQRREFDSLDAEIDALGGYNPQPRKTKANPIGGKLAQPGSVLDEHLRGGGGIYTNLFGRPSGSDGFKSLGEYLDVVASERYDNRLKRAQHRGDQPSSGGFAVPEQLIVDDLNAALENSIVLPRADVRPMKTSTLKVATFEDDDHSSSTLYGGFKAHWLDETGSITEETGKLRRIELNARKLALLTKSSNEVDEDAEAFEQQLRTALQSAASWHIDDAFINGDGAGKPKGLLKDAALISVAKETGQDANTITYQNVSKMFARLHPASVPNAVWICNPTTIPQLLTLAKDIGTAGEAVNVLQESNGQYRLLTRPVLFSEKVPALGSKGDIILADLTQYLVGMRRGISIEKSKHVGFENDEMTWRLIMRVDGQGKWDNVFKPKNGDNQSWVVTLNARA